MNLELLFYLYLSKFSKSNDRFRYDRDYININH